MSDKGEKTCPLCAEEMDLTDQQLKPCKCGYEICVWCWHHIMEMAEKDATEGRCPACRTPYDKEKIVAMAANCEKMLAEINSERKQKSQKAKPKASEGRMHLNNVRVIQRNLVYIIGLPLNLADEELLQQRDYFGQYGKVLKVSISRTATGAIQHSANNSCCVYITYAKEEEAVRCIQSVHSFVLDGKPLRACFGTTKYCHAWLRNMPCSIPDCLYLHDFGPQEDSFTKDEIVSAFTRSRDQQIIGASNNLHRRSGNVLPPPADEYIINSNRSFNAKAIANCSSNNVDNYSKGSSADSGSGRSNGLPAAASWVMRVSASLPQNTKFSGLDRPLSDPSKTSNGLHILKSDIASTPRSIHDLESVYAKATREMHLNSEMDPFESVDEFTDDDFQIATSHTNTETKIDPTASITAKNDSPCLPSSKDSTGGLAALPSSTRSLENTLYFSGPGSSGDKNHHAEDDMEGLYSGLRSVSLQNQLKRQCASVVSNGLVPKDNSVYLPGSQISQENVDEQFRQHVVIPSLREGPSVEDVQYHDDQQLTGLEGICHQQFIGTSVDPQSNSNQSSYLSWQPGKVNYQVMPMKSDEVDCLPLSSKNSMPKVFSGKEASRFVNLDATFDQSNVSSGIVSGNNLGKHDGFPGHLQNSVASDMGESSIISKILSIDSDAWEDSLTSPQSLVKLLKDNDNPQSSLTVPSLLKESDNRQSRFSFARQEDLSTHISDMDHSFGSIGLSAHTSSASNYFVNNKDHCLETNHNIFMPSSSMELDNFSVGHYLMPPSAVSKAPASSPQYGLPSRAPPPGFSTPWVMQKPTNSSADHLLQASAPAIRNDGKHRDFEFVDPAILEVRRYIQATGPNNQAHDVRQTSTRHLSPLDHNAELQLLMQQSISEFPNLGFPSSTTNRFSPPDDAYDVLPTVFDQSQSHNQYSFVQPTTQPFRSMHMSSGHLGTWNEVNDSSDFGTSDWMTNGGYGFNKFSPGYQDIKCQISSSSNMYNNGFAL